MKTFTLASGCVAAGITLTDAGRIAVGELGRGRSQVLAPLPAGSQVEGRKVLDIPGEAGSAAVLIADHSGFRGGWSLRAARTEAEWDAVLRRAVAHQPPDGMGALAEGHTEPWGRPWKCEACATVAPPPVDRPHGAKVIAQGARAQGDAGRAGGGPEYLLVLRDGQAVEIVRSGRLYGAPTTLRVECRGGVIAVSDPQAAAQQRFVATAW